MAERKVLNKYYDPTFDPSKIRRVKRSKDKQDNVRMMLPMTMRCNTCGTYLYIGTKFNMRKETCMDEQYLTIKIYRFYFRCRGCHAEITFKTDPKNQDYVAENGAKRNYEAWKDAQQEEMLLKEMKEQEEEGNAMKTLENKTYNSKREMDIIDALDDLQQNNKRKAQVSHDQLLDAFVSKEEEEDEDHDHDEAVKEMFRAAKEKELEEEEVRKTKELKEKLSTFIAPEQKTVTASSSLADVNRKKNSLGPKIMIKAKKPKTEQESQGNGTVNLLAAPKNTEKKNTGVVLCSYSSDDE